MMLAVILCVAIALVISIASAGRPTTPPDATKTSGTINPRARPKAPTSLRDKEVNRKRVASTVRTNQLLKKWLGKKIAFLDIETTGITGHDRVVTLAIILLELPTLSQGVSKVDVDLNALHRIYNPGRDCHPIAFKMHGHNDWKLRHQPFFIEEALEVSEYLAKADLVVCHNAEFDMRFMNREFAKAAMPPITAKSFCTMEEYRRKFSGSASLDSVVAQLGLRRESGKHSALEDAWLTMNVFFVLHNTSASWPFASLGNEKRKFENLREVPPMPEGILPPRKRRPSTRKAEAKSSENA